MSKLGKTLTLSQFMVRGQVLKQYRQELETMTIEQFKMKLVLGHSSELPRDFQIKAKAIL